MAVKLQVITADIWLAPTLQRRAGASSPERQGPAAHGLPGDAFYRDIFEASPSPFILLSPDLVILDANLAYREATMIDRAAVVGRAMFDVFPDNPADAGADGVANLGASLARVLAKRGADIMPVQRYDIRDREGAFVPRWWTPRNVPVLDSAGEVVAIIHHVEDVTASMVGDSVADAALTKLAALRMSLDARAHAASADSTATLEELEKARTAARESAEMLRHRIIEIGQQICATAPKPKPPPR